MAFAAHAAEAADPVRGGALYELRCGTCHSASVHGRTKRLASDFVEIRQQVIRWSENLGLDWDHDDVDDVTVHLNGAYYRFPCPARLCTVISDCRRIWRGGYAVSGVRGRSDITIAPIPARSAASTTRPPRNGMRPRSASASIASIAAPTRQPMSEATSAL